METKLETVLHGYSFDVRTPAGAAAWETFKAERAADGARIMGPVWHEQTERLAYDGATLALETTHLFDNQWNATAPDGAGFRAFDWLLEAEQSHPTQRIGAPRGIKRGYWLEQTPAMRELRESVLKCGYWLEQTPAMRELRESVLKCGYCGAQHAAEGAPDLCPDCIGSEYLKPEDFHLTRLVPVARTFDKRPPLTEAEHAARLEVWREAQREGTKTRAGAKLAAFRERVEKDHAAAIETADRKRGGLLWLLDNDLGGLAADNVLFYSHTGRFGIGWRTPLDSALAAEVMGKLSDAGFPYPYDVETTDGKRSGTVEG